jgi:anti-anti-sigma regulatory factor
MSQTTLLRVAHTDQGYVVVVEGRGTLCESPAVEAFAAEVLLQQPERTLVIDLHECLYLDSTFLGCLVTLHKEFGKLRPPRFFVAAPADCRARLLAATYLDRHLNLLDTAPAVAGDWLPLPTAPLGAQELGRHVMECHRRLAELGSPCSAAFNRVADQIAQELDATQAKASQRAPS